MFKNLSISRKLTWTNMLVSGAALLLACASFIGYDLVTFRQATAYNVSIQAQITGSNAVSALLFDDQTSAEKTLSALRASPNILSAGILTLDGQPFASYVRDPGAAAPVLPQLAPGQTETYHFGSDGVLLVRSIVFEGKPTGIIYIHSGTQALYGRLRLYAEISAIVLAVSLLMDLLVSSRFQREISRPITQLAEIAQQVSRDKNYSVRAAPANSHDEVAVMVEAFNGMLSQIQARDAELRRAHDELELRVHERTAELTLANELLTSEVAERKATEEALRQSEERFRLMVSDVKDYAILMLDPDGRVASWNVGAERTKGYQAEEIMGQHFSRFYPEEEIQSGKPTASLQTALQKGRSEDEGWRVRKDGSRFWADVVITALRDKTGELRGFCKVTRDVTVRKRNEELLHLRNAQLETANKELDAFSYSVSHDLRAPLRGIDGFSQALLEDYNDKLDSTGQDYLQRVRLAAQRMSVLIDDLLNLSRVTRSEIRREKLDLSAIVRSAADELHRAAPERNVKFVITDGLTADGDSRLLRVAIENLLGNAWKYTSAHSCARIEFGFHEDNGRSAYFVRDDGAGFDPRYSERLFGAFQRLHAVTEFPGTGIGLATVQRIIRRHGGEIWAEGAVEKGATFYFTL
jgi:PAS domain S-box-containing protein